MALKNQTVEFWDGETRAIVLKNLKDEDGATVDFSTATAASLKITTEKGGGTTIISKTLVDMTATSTSLTCSITDANWTSGSGVAGTRYWWELSVNFGGGLQQMVAPSHCYFRESAT